jgi:hypothetical protein
VRGKPAKGDEQTVVDVVNNSVPLSAPRSQAQQVTG